MHALANIPRRSGTLRAVPRRSANVPPVRAVPPRASLDPPRALSAFHRRRVAARGSHPLRFSGRFLSSSSSVVAGAPPRFRTPAPSGRRRILALPAHLWETCTSTRETGVRRRVNLAVLLARCALWGTAACRFVRCGTACHCPCMLAHLRSSCGMQSCTLPSLFSGLM